MKTAALVVLLLLGMLAPAARTQEEYPITVHVTSSYFQGGVYGRQQEWDVVIDGKKYSLAGGTTASLLALGDYKAKLVKELHKTTYESYREYELLLPDKKTRKFVVVRQSE
jgi:hypothetical protein